MSQYSVASALVIIVKLGVLVSLLIVAGLLLVELLVIHINIGILVEVLDALRVGSPYEVGLHVVYLAFRVHQVLLLFPFNLNHPHYHAINHVNGFAFVFRSLLVLINRGVVNLGIILSVVSILL